MYSLYSVTCKLLHTCNLDTDLKNKQEQRLLLDSYNSSVALFDASGHCFFYTGHGTLTRSGHLYNINTLSTNRIMR